MSYAVLRFYKLNKFLHASIDIFPFFPDKADLLLNNRNNGNSHQPRKIFQKGRIQKRAAQIILDEILDGEKLAGVHDHVGLDPGPVKINAQGGILDRVGIVHDDGLVL